MVFVFNFSLSKRSFAMDTPLDRLKPFINITLQKTFDKRSRYFSLVRVVHSFVRIFPVAKDSKPFKLLSLNGNVLFSVIPAKFPEFVNVEVINFFTVFLFNCLFNGKSVAIPTWLKIDILSKKEP